jgi:hypothetical protein
MREKVAKIPENQRLNRRKYGKNRGVGVESGNDGRKNYTATKIVEKSWF